MLSKGRTATVGLPSSGAEESVGSLAGADLEAFRERLITGRNGVVGVFGDLDLDRTEDLVRSAFEGMPEGTRPFAGGAGIALPESYGQTAEATHEKEQAILLIGGDKGSDKRFYERMTPIADALYEEHLASLREDGP